MNTTAIAMGYTAVPHEALYNIIGVSLEQGFMDLYGMKPDEIEYAMNNYSKLYSMKGEEMILLYDGIDEALKNLKDDGYLLAIVTQKNQKFIHNILGVYKNIGEHFDTVCASDVDIELEKSDMLRKVCAELGIMEQDSIFVGDSYVDALAAQEVGMDFAAALYGLGFRSEDETKQYQNCRACLKNAGEIYTKLSKL
jgi:phosphoglycolate phosphatase